MCLVDITSVHRLCEEAEVVVMRVSRGRTWSDLVHELNLIIDGKTGVARV